MGSPSPSSGPKLKRSSSTTRNGPVHRRSSSSITSSSCISLESGDQDLLQFSSPAKIITGKNNVFSSPRTPAAAGGAASPAALKKRRSSIGGLDDLAKGLDFSNTSSAPVNEEKKLHSFLTKGGGHKKVSPAAAQASSSPGKRTGPVTGKEKPTVAAGRATSSPRKSTELSKKDMPSSPRKVPEVSRSMNGITTPKKSSPLRASLDRKLSSPLLTPKSLGRTSELAAADALLQGDSIKKTERRPSPSPSLRSLKSSSAGRKLTPSPPQLGRARTRTDNHAELSRPEMESVTVYSQYEFDRDATKKTSDHINMMPDHVNMMQHDEEVERSALLASLIQVSGNDMNVGGQTLDHEPTSWLSEDNVSIFSSLSQLPDDMSLLGDPPLSSNGYLLDSVVSSPVEASNGVYDQPGSVDHELNSFCDKLDDPVDGFESQLYTERDADFELSPHVDTFEAELRTQIETTFDSPQLPVPRFVVPVAIPSSVDQGETMLSEDVSSDNQSIEAFLQSCSSQDLQTGEVQSQRISGQGPSEEAPISFLDDVEDIHQLDRLSEPLISAPDVKLEEERRPIVEVSTTDEQVVESSDDESLEDIVEDSQLNLKQSFDDVAEPKNRDLDEIDHADDVPAMVDSPREDTYAFGLQELALSTETEFAPEFLDGPTYNLEEDMKIFEEDWTQSTADDSDAGQNDADDLSTAEDEAENSLPPAELPVSILPVIGKLKMTVEETEPHATKLEIVEEIPPKDDHDSTAYYHDEAGATTKLENVEEIPPKDDPDSTAYYRDEAGATTKLENVEEIPPKDGPHSTVSLDNHHAEVGAAKVENVEEIPPNLDELESTVSLDNDHFEVGAIKFVEVIPSKDEPDSTVSVSNYHDGVVATKDEYVVEMTPKDGPDSTMSSDNHQVNITYQDEESDEVFHLYGAGSDEVILFDHLSSSSRPENPMFEDVGEFDSHEVGTTQMELDAQNRAIEHQDFSIKAFPPHDTSGDDDSFSETGEACTNQAPSNHEEPQNSSNALNGVKIQYFDDDDHSEYLHLEGPELSLGSPIQDSSFETPGVSERHIAHEEFELRPENPENFHASCVQAGDGDRNGSAQDDCIHSSLEMDFSGPRIVAETDDISHDLDLKISPKLTEVEGDQTMLDFPHSGAIATTKEVDPSESNDVGGNNIDKEHLTGASAMEEESFNGDDGTTTSSGERVENSIPGHEVQMDFDPEEHQNLSISEEGADILVEELDKEHLTGANVMEEESFYGDDGASTSSGEKQEGIMNYILGHEVQMDFDPEEHQDLYISEEGANILVEELDKEHLTGANVMEEESFYGDDGTSTSSGERQERIENSILGHEVQMDFDPEEHRDLYISKEGANMLVGELDEEHLTEANVMEEESFYGDDGTSTSSGERQEGIKNSILSHEVQMDFDPEEHQDLYISEEGANMLVGELDKEHLTEANVMEEESFYGDDGTSTSSGERQDFRIENSILGHEVQMDFDPEEHDQNLYISEEGADILVGELDKEHLTEANVMEEESFYGDDGTTTSSGERQERVENSILGRGEAQLYLEHQGLQNSEEGADVPIVCNSTELRDNSFQDMSSTSRDIEVPGTEPSQIHGDEEFQENERISAPAAVESSHEDANTSEVDHKQWSSSPGSVTLEDCSEASDDNSIYDSAEKSLPKRAYDESNTFNEEDDTIPDQLDANSEVISTASLNIGTETPTASPTDVLGKEEVPFVFSAEEVPLNEVNEFDRHDQTIVEVNEEGSVLLGDQCKVELDPKEINPLDSTEDQWDSLHEAESNVFRGRVDPFSPTQEADARGDTTDQDLVIDEASNIVSATPSELIDHHDPDSQGTQFLMFGTSISSSDDQEDVLKVEKTLSDAPLDEDLREDDVIKDAEIISGNSSSQGLPLKLCQDALNADDAGLQEDTTPWKGDTEGESLEQNLAPEEVDNNEEKLFILDDVKRKEDSRDNVYLNGEPVLSEDEEKVVFSPKNSNGCACFDPETKIMDIYGTIDKDEYQDATERLLLEVEDTSDDENDIQRDPYADSEKEHTLLKDEEMAMESSKDPAILDVEQSNSSWNSLVCKEADVLEDEENGVDNVVVQETPETGVLDVCDVQNHSYVSWSTTENDERFHGSCLEEESMLEEDEDTVMYRSVEPFVESGQCLSESTPLLVDEKTDPKEVKLNGEVVSEVENTVSKAEEVVIEAQEMVVDNHEELPLVVEIDTTAEALMVGEEINGEREIFNQDIIERESMVEMVDRSPTFESRIAPYADAEDIDVVEEIQHPDLRADEEDEALLEDSSVFEEREVSGPKESLFILDEGSTNAAISGVEEEIPRPDWRTDEEGEASLEDRSTFEEKEVSRSKESLVISDEEYPNAAISDVEKETQHPTSRADEEGEALLEERSMFEEKGESSLKESRVIPDKDSTIAAISGVEEEIQRPTWRTDEEGEALLKDRPMLEEIEVIRPVESLVISDEYSTNAAISDVHEKEIQHPASRADEEGEALLKDRSMFEEKEVSRPTESLVISNEENPNHADVSDADEGESTSNRKLEDETVMRLKDQENSSSVQVLVCQLPDSVNGSLQSDKVGEELERRSNGAMTSDEDALDNISKDALKVEKVEVSSPKESLVLSDEENKVNADHISDAGERESTSTANLEGVQLKDQENSSSGTVMTVCQANGSELQSDKMEEELERRSNGAMTNDKDALANISKDAFTVEKVEVSSPKDSLAISDEEKKANADHISDAGDRESTSTANLEGVQLKDRENSSSGTVMTVCQANGSELQSDKMGEELDRRSNGAMTNDKDALANVSKDAFKVEKVEVSSPKESLVISDEEKKANADHISDAGDRESTSNANLEEETAVQLKDQENSSSGTVMTVCQANGSLQSDKMGEELERRSNGAMTSDKGVLANISKDAVKVEKVEVSSPKESLVISDEEKKASADHISDADERESTSNANLEEETVVQLKHQESDFSGHVLACQVPDKVLESQQSGKMGEELERHSNGALRSDKDVDEGEFIIQESEPLALVKETWMSNLERTPQDMDSPDQEPQTLYPDLQPPFSGSKQDHLWEEQAEAYSSGGQGTPKAAAAPSSSEATQTFACDDQIQPASAGNTSSKERLHTPLRSLLLEDSHKTVDGDARGANHSPSFIRRLFRVKSTPSRAASERDLSQSKHKKSTSMWVSCLGSPQVKQ